MLNNWINPEEIPYLFNKIRSNPERLLKFISKIPFSKSAKVKNTWSTTNSPPNNWWDIPAVQARWNFLISGDEEIDYCDYITGKYLNNNSSLKALSLGCGSGERELRWAEMSQFASIDAFDLSENRIKYAIQIANQECKGHIINYQVGNIYDIEMQEDFYDIVFAEQSLHHFSPLETLLLKIENTLKHDGYFILNEFVGPTRFQWSDRQLELVNSLIKIFPEKYKKLWNSPLTKPKVIKHSKLSMILRDPSEAIESSNILPLLHEIFDVVEVKGYGGAILHLLLGGIAHHFLDPDDLGQRLLNICFKMEDLLTDSGEIKNDFMVAICRKKRK
jgi:ubiquinone/menaquinone biosynthesis C-methylase UbiE